MRHATTREHTETAELIANRYRVEGTLGKGGMATVYLVLDTTTERRVALKRPYRATQPDVQEEILASFEHEFHTLAQLAHPRVVEAYDFGRDDCGPYYTMELLDGGDLRELSPLPWKRACSLLADVCSALSLLHSRRLVYRDLSHRNVRCTQDLKAKLIDFGAMVPMGPCKHVVGTPIFTAPEVVALQSLDARADLYSLGTVLYYALTAQPPYPARDFSDLRNSWRSKPRPPSALVDEIPNELDHLVLSLIDLDPVARPANAAEVAERLSAIAGFEVDEQLLASQAYLSTPTLVGRRQHMVQVRRRMLRLRRHRGAAFLVEGAAGAGRTRFLDACVLEAKLAGATVLRVDANDARAGDWSAARVMATQLIDELPELALEAAKPHLPVLGHMLPELLSSEVPHDSPPPALSVIDPGQTDSATNNTQQAQPVVSLKPSVSPGPDPLGSVKPSVGPSSQPSVSRRPSVGPSPLVDGARRFRAWSLPPQMPKTPAVLETFDSPGELRPRLQAALRDWFFDVCEEHLLMMAVDDVHRIDEPSAALVARIANEISQKPMVVAATAVTDGSVTAPGAMKVVRQSAARIELTNLGLNDTEQLLGSVFGETANLRLVADRLHGATDGNPRGLMELAQHLVDKGAARYHAGAWTLPGRIYAADLPDSLAEALAARAKKLPPKALQLAQTLALSPGQTFSLEECLVLGQETDKTRLLKGLQELVASGILSTDGQYYSLSQQTWVSPLIDDLDPQAKRGLHLSMAEVFSLRGSSDFRVAMHFLAAGEDERGLDVLVHDAETGLAQLVRDSAAFYKHIQSLPSCWLDTYKRALDLCQLLHRPRKHAFLLRLSLVRFSILTGLEDTSPLYDVVDQLKRDSGLGFYEELDDSMDADKRLWRALELAQQRYDESAESERVLAPAEAVQELGKAINYVMGTASNAYDISIIEAMPSLKPLEPLSPALGIAQRILNIGLHMQTARYEQAMQEIRELLDRIAQPDRAGLDEMLHKIIHYSWCFGMGVFQASFGIPSSLEWADEIEQDSLHRVNAWRIRTVYHLRRGDSEKADECKRRVEALRIQNSPTQHFEDTNLVTELLAYTSADDMARVKGVMEGIERVARRYATWKPFLLFAKAEYQRIRGDYQSALSEIEQGLALAKPGRHAVWPHLAGAQVRLLFALERFSEGKEIGYQRLREAEEQDIRNSSNHIRMPLALIEAQLGEHESAVKHAETAIENYNELGATGLSIGLAYEIRARVAILMKDSNAFGEYAQLCAEQYQAGDNPVLTAKYQKLVQEARLCKLGVSGDLAHAADVSQSGSEDLPTLIGGVLTQCQGPQDRVRRALDILVQTGHCSGGFLYTMYKDGPVLCCHSGDSAPPGDMDATVTQYVQRQTDDCGDATMTAGAFSEAASSEFDWRNDHGDEYFPLLLGHDSDEGFLITGVAVLLPNPEVEFMSPVEAAAIVSKSLLEAGDVPAPLMSD